MSKLEELQKQEENKAIKYLEGYTKYTQNRAIEEYKSECRNIQYAKDLEKRGCIFEIILNLIQKLQEDRKEKDKIIDLMAEEIARHSLRICPSEEYDDLEHGNKCNNDCKECWKKYFERKSEEV